MDVPDLKKKIEFLARARAGSRSEAAVSSEQAGNCDEGVSGRMEEKTHNL